MPTEILMPDMGEDIAEGTVLRWLVSPGEHVEEKAPVLEISTDKVDAEIASPASGTLLEILCQAGETVPVGGVLGRIDEAARPRSSENP